MVCYCILWLTAAAKVWNPALLTMIRGGARENHKGDTESVILRIQAIDGSISRVSLRSEQTLADLHAMLENIAGDNVGSSLVDIKDEKLVMSQLLQNSTTINSLGFKNGDWVKLSLPPEIKNARKKSSVPSPSVQSRQVLKVKRYKKTITMADIQAERDKMIKIKRQKYDGKLIVQVSNTMERILQRLAIQGGIAFVFGTVSIDKAQVKTIHALSMYEASSQRLELPYSHDIILQACSKLARALAIAKACGMQLVAVATGCVSTTGDGADEHLQAWNAYTLMTALHLHSYMDTNATLSIR